MAEPVTIARPYADAVYKLAREKNVLAQWSDALANLDAVVADTRVQAIIGDPNVSAQQLEGLVLGVIGDKLDALVANEARSFIQVLVQDRSALVCERARMRKSLNQNPASTSISRVNKNTKPSPDAVSSQ